jgi:hypothetical protein
MERRNLFWVTFSGLTDLPVLAYRYQVYMRSRRFDVPITLNMSGYALKDIHAPVGLQQTETGYSERPNLY